MCRGTTHMISIKQSTECGYATSQCSGGMNRFVELVLRVIGIQTMHPFWSDFGGSFMKPLLQCFELASPAIQSVVHITCCSPDMNRSECRGESMKMSVSSQYGLIKIREMWTLYPPEVANWVYIVWYLFKLNALHSRVKVNKPNILPAVVLRTSV